VKFRHANASTDHLKISQACLNSLMTQKMEKKYPQNQKQVAKLLLWKASKSWLRGQKFRHG